MWRVILWSGLALATNPICSVLNGGSSSYQGTAQMFANVGWYYGLAGTAQAPLLVFTYNHPNEDSFVFTMVDAWCPGDRFFIFIQPPNTPQDVVISTGGAQVVNCTSPAYTTNPNVAIQNAANFARYTRTYVSGVNGILTGTWKFWFFLSLPCAPGSTLDNVGIYAKIDSAVLTEAVCAFSTGSITTSLQPIPPAKVVTTLAMRPVSRLVGTNETLVLNFH